MCVVTLGRSAYVHTAIDVLQSNCHDSDCNFEPRNKKTIPTVTGYGVALCPV
jgi:hypothetical protein